MNRMRRIVLALICLLLAAPASALAARHGAKHVRTAGAHARKGAGHTRKGAGHTRKGARHSPTGAAATRTGVARGMVVWVDQDSLCILLPSRHTPRRAVAAKLRTNAHYGALLTFRAGPGVDLSDFAGGDQVRVAYSVAHGGTLITSGVTYTAEKTDVGVLMSVDSDQGTFTVQSANGNLTFDDELGLVDSSQLGDRLQVTYTSRPTGLAAHAVQDLAPATPLEATGTITQMAGDESSLSIQTASGQNLTLATEDPSLLDAFAVGQDVQVTYVQVGSALIASDVEAVTDPTLDGTGTTDDGATLDGNGTVTQIPPNGSPTLDVTGAITQIASDGSSLTLQTDSGQSLTFHADGDTLDGFQVGDSVDVTYTQDTTGGLSAQDVEYQ